MVNLKVLFLLYVILYSSNSCNENVDERTFRAGESGSEVVHAVIRRIEDSNIFPPDHLFLRRIAFVESKDGTDSGTYRDGYNGGIWQVDEVGFRETQNTGAHKTLAAKLQRIQEEFGINWHGVKWEDLRKPFYSGLAARLYISNVKDDIPVSIRAQGKYWKKHYNTAAGAGNAQKYVDDVQALLRKKTKMPTATFSCLTITPSLQPSLTLPYVLPTNTLHDGQDTSE